MTTPITLIQLDASPSAPSSGTWKVNPTDPARSVMTDFADTNMVTVEAAAQIDVALEVMRHAGVRSAFVLSADKKSVAGFVTAYDIMGERPLRYLQTAGGGREDVQVQHVMERAEDWLVVRYADTERATVQTMLDAFAKSGRTHLAVVEEEPGQKAPRLRGVFSGAKLLRLTRRR